LERNNSKNELNSTLGIPLRLPFKRATKSLTKSEIYGVGPQKSPETFQEDGSIDSKNCFCFVFEPYILLYYIILNKNKSQNH
jgi:hypothetical protein